MLKIRNPIHKKGDKQTIKNYRTVSILPICDKIFERRLYTKKLYLFGTKFNISTAGRLQN